MSARLIIAVAYFSIACAVPAADRSVSTNSPSSQPLTAEQAKAALDRKQEHKPGAGTWRYVTISMDPLGTTIQTNYLYITTNNQRFERIEETVRVTNKTSSVKTYLRIKDSAGSWALHQKIAILTPQETGSTQSASKDDEFDLGKEFESLAVFSGERFTQGNRMLLHVVGHLNAEARRKAVDLLIKHLKKEKDVPFYARILMSTMKGKMADALPGRFESVIEEETGALVLEALYDKDGRLIVESYYWEICPDLPPEKFIIPENLERVRPKTAKDARELEQKTRDQEAKSAKSTK